MSVKKINKLYILFFVLFVSCSKRESITNYQDIYIYTSDKDHNSIHDVVDNYLFDFSYYTPNPEKRYNSKSRTAVDFMNKPLHSLLMIISIEEFRDSTVDAIVKHLTSNSNDKISFVNDYYAKDQLLFILKYKDSQDLISGLSSNKEWILEKLKENDYKKLSKYSFRSGLNEELISTAEDMFGVNIKIQKDYKKIKINDDENFFWIGRGYPYRWILLYEDIQKYYQTPKLSWERLESKFNEILDINIISYKTQFETSSFNNKTRKIYGVYGTKIDSENPTGGPFLSYIIDQPQSNKVLIASGFVNFPGKNKVFHIKELEYILETIK